MIYFILFSCAQEEVIVDATPPPPKVEEKAPEPPKVEETNMAPVFEKAEFFNKQPTAQTEIRVVVEANDPDLERVRLDYRWSVNGISLPSEHRDILSMGRVKKGDEVIVTILATDGKSESKKQLFLTVANASPFWLEDPRLSGDLNGFTVSASDPDEDPINYRVAGAPSGLSIHPTKGAIKYEGTNDEPGGEYNISVFAEDPDKLFVKWDFSIQVTPGSNADK